MLRDAVVLALPMQPVCQDDCPGLCSECGERLRTTRTTTTTPSTSVGRHCRTRRFTEDGEKDEMGGAEPGVDEKQEK
ncbi:hypothetical protein SALBM217S_08556 [Streptomyces griseoloalbus]